MSKTRQVIGIIRGRTDATNDGQRRIARVVQAVLSGLAGRFVGVVVSFVSVPLTITYLGAERYGMWVTISSLLAWLQLADLGLANSLTNAIAEANGEDRPDLARRSIATAFAVMTGIALFLGAIVAIVYPFINWAALFNVHTPAAQAEAGPTIIIGAAVFLGSFPLSLVGRIYTAYQEGSIANYWAAAANALSLISVVLVTQLHGNLVVLVFAFSGTQLLVSGVSVIWLFTWHKPELRLQWRDVRLASSKKLLKTGWMFFVVQIAWLLIFQTDNLIIAHFAGADQVTPYSITYRLFGYTTLLPTLVFTNLWPAYTEAMTRKDVNWVQRTFRSNMQFSVLVTLGSCVPLVIFGSTIIRLWTRSADAVPPFDLIAWMAVWSVINTCMNAAACLLSASGRIRNQMFYALATAAANIGLSIVLVKSYGITGVIEGTVIAYMIFDFVPSLIDSWYTIRQLPYRTMPQTYEPVTASMPVVTGGPLELAPVAARYEWLMEENTLVRLKAVKREGAITTESRAVRPEGVTMKSRAVKSAVGADRESAIEDRRRPR